MLTISISFKIQLIFWDNSKQNTRTSYQMRARRVFLHITQIELLVIPFWLNIDNKIAMLNTSAYNKIQYREQAFKHSFQTKFLLKMLQLRLYIYSYPYSSFYTFFVYHAHFNNARLMYFFWSEARSSTFSHQFYTIQTHHSDDMETTSQVQEKFLDKSAICFPVSSSWTLRSSWY